MNANVRQIEARTEETSEWVEAFEQVLADEGNDRRRGDHPIDHKRVLASEIRSELWIRNMK